MMTKRDLNKGNITFKSKPIYSLYSPTKKKNDHRIISVEREKAFENIQHLFLLKTQQIRNRMEYP